MAIELNKETKKQKYLVVILLIIIVVAFLIVWFGYLNKSSFVPAVSPAVFYREIKINFETLKSSVLSELNLFEKVAPFSGTIGKDNPFLGGGKKITETSASPETAEEETTEETTEEIPTEEEILEEEMIEE